MKSFDILYNHPVTGTKEYNGYTYLPWEQCLIQFREAAELKKLEFNFGPTEWTPAYPNGSRYAIVHVTVFADTHEWKLAYPVISGDVPISNPNSFDIHAAQQRAFVKCIAINSGFGLKLWVDKGGREAPSEKPDLGGQIVSLFGQLVPKMGTPDDVHKFLGTTEKSLAQIVDGKGDQQSILDKLQGYFQDELPFDETAPDEHNDATQEHINEEVAKEQPIQEIAEKALKGSFVTAGEKMEKPVFKSPFDD